MHPGPQYAERSSTSHNDSVSSNLGRVRLPAVLHFLDGLLQQVVGPSQVTHEGDVSLFGSNVEDPLRGGRKASQSNQEISLI